MQANFGSRTSLPYPTNWNTAYGQVEQGNLPPATTNHLHPISSSRNFSECTPPSDLVAVLESESNAETSKDDWKDNRGIVTLLRVAKCVVTPANTEASVSVTTGSDGLMYMVPGHIWWSNVPTDFGACKCSPKDVNTDTSRQFFEETGNVAKMNVIRRRNPPPGTFCPPETSCKHPNQRGKGRR